MYKGLKVSFLALALLPLAGCGVQQTSQVPQLDSVANSSLSKGTIQGLIAEGYVEVAPNAYIMKGVDGSVSFYTHDTDGQRGLLTFLASGQGQGNSVVIGTQSVKTGLLREALTEFFKKDPGQAMTPSNNGAPLTPQDARCTRYNSTYNAGGTKTYAYATGAVPASNCYGARLQVDSGYPQSSLVSNFTNNGANCTGNNCFNSGTSTTGYPQNGQCYSGVYITLNDTFFSPNDSFGKSYTC